MPENVDPSLCTHIIYAFAKMSGNRLAPYEWNDENTAWSTGMYEILSHRSVLFQQDFVLTLCRLCVIYFKKGALFTSKFLVTL